MAKTTKRQRAARKAKRRKAALDPRWRRDPRAVVIMGEVWAKITANAAGKTFDPAAQAEVEDHLGPRLKRRKDMQDDWDNLVVGGGQVKDRPLVVAGHLGQIAAILSVGHTITKKVAMAATLAIKKDEHCTVGMGSGDWCA
jgi:acetyl-CoA carboxylase beta subunit